MTVLALLRLRFKLTVHGKKERLLLVEEANAIGFAAGDAPVITGEAARALLEAQAAGNLAAVARDRLIAQARERIAGPLTAELAAFAQARAEALSQDHGRIRAAGVNVSRVTVEAVLPPDVVGLFILVPGAL